jgi:hypothetical protein
MIQKQFRIDRTFEVGGGCVLAVLTDQNGQESFHTFTREWFDGALPGERRRTRYKLPSHERTGPLPPAWQDRLEGANRKEHQP